MVRGAVEMSISFIIRQTESKWAVRESSWEVGEGKGEGKGGREGGGSGVVAEKELTGKTEVETDR